MLLDPTIDVDASVASGFSQRDDERSGSGSHRKMDELREMLPALHRIAKQLTFSNGIPFIFFGHFILVLRFPSSREFQFEICFARSFLCFLNYTLQHHWICVRSLDPYKLLMFWSPLDLRLRCKFASAKQISNQNSRDEGNLKTEKKWTKQMEKNEWNSIRKRQLFCNPVYCP